MSTVIFDFDSTLVRCESLEEILKPKFVENEGLETQVREITNLGMAGQIDFRESLARRLALAAPSRKDVAAFAESGQTWLTDGMASLVSDLLARDVAVKIVSGGLREGILPLAQSLGIGPKHVHAVRLDWFPDGSLRGIDPNDGFSVSKLVGLKPLIDDWTSPRVAVGDGMTDYHLASHGLVDHFIAFTGNVRREEVVAQAVPEATHVPELKRILEKLL